MFRNTKHGGIYKLSRFRLNLPNALLPQGEDNGNLVSSRVLTYFVKHVTDVLGAKSLAVNKESINNAFGGNDSIRKIRCKCKCK